MIYSVVWAIDVDAETPEEAALMALTIQRDPSGIATQFEVISEFADHFSIDLLCPTIQ
jgi:hypothetical protein